MTKYDKTLLVLLGIALVAITFTSAAYGQDKEVTCEEDRFTGTVTCNTPWRFPERLDADFGRSGVMFVKSEAEQFMLITIYADEWQWLNSDNIYFLIDNEQRYQAKLVSVDREVMDAGRVSESYAIMEIENPELFEAIADAETVEYKAGDDSFVLADESISDYKTLREKINK